MKYLYLLKFKNQPCFKVGVTMTDFSRILRHHSTYDIDLQESFLITAHSGRYIGALERLYLTETPMFCPDQFKKKDGATEIRHIDYIDHILSDLKNKQQIRPELKIEITKGIALPVAEETTNIKKKSEWLSLSKEEKRNRITENKRLKLLEEKKANGLNLETLEKILRLLSPFQKKFAVQEWKHDDRYIHVIIDYRPVPKMVFDDDTLWSSCCFRYDGIFSRVIETAAYNKDYQLLRIEFRFWRDEYLLFPDPTEWQDRGNELHKEIDQYSHRAKEIVFKFQ